MKKRILILIGVVLVLGVGVVGVVWYSNHKDHDIDVLIARGECVIDWSRAYGSDPSNIDSELKRRLCLLAEQTGTRIIPNTGYRSAAEQQALGDELLRDNPSYYRDEEGAVRDGQGRLMAEAPGNSQHETGDAVDLNRGGVSGQFYTDEELQKAGLTNKPTVKMPAGPNNPALKKKEPWHLTIDPDYTE